MTLTTTKNKKNLTGKKFNHLTVIDDSGIRTHRKIIWNCICDCGNLISVVGNSLVTGNTKTCGQSSCPFRKITPLKNVVVKAPHTIVGSLTNQKVITSGIIAQTGTIVNTATIINTGTILTCPIVTAASSGYSYDYYLNDMQSVFGIADQVKSTTFLKNSKEISLVYDSKKIAINFNLLSNSHIEPPANKNRNSNRDILNECIALGYKCFTIYENEWLSKRDKIINFLKSSFNMNTNTVYARNCIVKKVTKKEAKDFLSIEHIQGLAHLSTRYYGLHNKDTNELLGVMTTGHHHRNQSVFNNNYTVVLDRFAIKSGYNVPGGASKLLSFIKNDLKNDGITQIVSWADRRMSSGNLYTMLGFTLHDTLLPDYSYWDSTNPIPTILGKQANKKCNLGTPPGVTEYEDTKTRFFRYRIFDCGKLVFTLQF